MQRRQFIRNTGWMFVGAGLVQAQCNFIHKSDVDVLILGAGLSGLYAAMLLEEQGISYRVLEADQRVGGRIYTLDTIPFQPEVGAVEVGDGYRRLLKIAEQLEVKTKPGSPFPRQVLLNIGGENITAAEWSGHPKNKLPERLRNIPPYLLENSGAKRQMPYQGISDWFKEAFIKLDYPFVQFLKANGFDDEAIRLLNTAANYNDVQSISLAQVFRGLAYRSLGGSRSTLRIAGGSSRLPQAMAKQLSNPVQLNKVVNTIREERQQVVVSCTDGSKHTAKKVICTIPFPALRTIDFSAPLNAAQQTAIKDLQYTQITQVIIGIKAPFWQEDGLPELMWTDSPIERIFPIKDQDEETVLLKAFINGQGAKDLDRLSPAELHQLTLRTLHSMRPAAEGKVEVLSSFSWGKHPYAMGAYAEFQAGQVKELVPKMAQPAGRIHFAGEHTAFKEKGMEGALASAERAVSNCVAQL